MATLPTIGGNAPAPFVGGQGFYLSAFSENPVIAQSFLFDQRGAQVLFRGGTIRSTRVTRVGLYLVVEELLDAIPLVREHTWVDGPRVSDEEITVRKLLVATPVQPRRLILDLGHGVAPMFARLGDEYVGDPIHVSQHRCSEAAQVIAALGHVHQ